jgi:DNA-binding NarL/FixJ family response regulator
MKSHSYPVTTIIADAHPLFRQGLQELLHGFESVQLLGEASTDKELIRLVAEHHPRLVITAIGTPIMGGLLACTHIHKRYPATAIIALSFADDDNTILSLVAAGAKACILKEKTALELREAITVVSRGEMYPNETFSRALRSLYSSPNQQKQTKTILSFSERELQVISLICRQYTGRQIANALSLSPRTVEDIRASIQQKIGVRSGVGIAIYALKTGLVSVE